MHCPVPLRMILPLVLAHSIVGGTTTQRLYGTPSGQPIERFGGSQPIHSGNVAATGVYIFIGDARYIKPCYLAQCSNPCMGCLPIQVSVSRY